MARKELTEKLDTITYQELGVTFDEGLIWEKLESRMGNAPEKRKWNRLMVASLFLGVLLLPFRVLKKDSSLNYDPPVNQKIIDPTNLHLMTTADIKLEDDIQLIENTFTNPGMIKTRSLELVVAKITIPQFKKTEISQPKAKNIKPQFVAEDISVIQASLGNAAINNQRIEKGRKRSIRARWESSTKNEVTIESNQVLKIILSASRMKGQE
ncbi:MAG: hypothetical protein AAF600_19840 [Bacteroidota bacterium]